MQLLLKLNSQAVLVGYKNMKKNLFPILLILLTSLYSQNIYSAVVNETAADAVVCVASGAMLDDDTACKTTPSQYSIKTAVHHRGNPWQILNWKQSLPLIRLLHWAAANHKIYLSQKNRLLPSHKQKLPQFL